MHLRDRRHPAVQRRAADARSRPNQTDRSRPGNGRLRVRRIRLGSAAYRLPELVDYTERFDQADVRAEARAPLLLEKHAIHQREDLARLIVIFAAEVVDFLLDLFGARIWVSFQPCRKSIQLLALRV